MLLVVAIREGTLKECLNQPPFVSGPVVMDSTFTQFAPPLLEMSTTKGSVFGALPVLLEYQRQ
jgi:hypothetical protein